MCPAGPYACIETEKKKPLKALSAAVGACPELSNVQDCKVNRSDRLLLIGAHVALLRAGRQQLHQTYQRFAPRQARARKIRNKIK